MDWRIIISALALFFIFEGLLPFANPESLKKMSKAMLEIPDSSLRIMGLASIVVGLILLYSV